MQPILDLRSEYHYGRKLRDEVQKEMLDGKPICCSQDAGLLTQIICNTRGNDHLEIGTAYGGTAIIALKAMDYCGRNNKVVCIDPFVEAERSTVHKAVHKEFGRNLNHFGIRDRIEHIKKFSHPFPIRSGRRFTTALIDGDHSYKWVLRDWNNVKEVTDCYVMFHDYTKNGVRQVVNEHAIQDPNWDLVSVHGWSAVLCKRQWI